ncbi:hypothetical protein BDW59DRAFT_160291 [Aspergillus cavernicola]|uniref:F-box domain-containing protein n=1 Tax=Aspergillus cavernicola TaxID=176166 RepID=A0ABR4IJD2_9EURO
MRSTDPLQCFSVECASAVFRYLAASDIAQYEGVSRGWRTFTCQWMASFGLRLHYPHEVACPGTLEPDMAMMIFKSHAALRSNIKRGRPSNVRKYERTRAFLVAGDFCVWLKHNEGIFWQRLSHQADVSPQPRSLLDPAGAFHGHHDPAELMVLGATGYLLIRYPVDPPPGTNLVENYRDTLYCLKTGTQMLTHRYQRESYDVPRFIPLLVGENRVYWELLYRAETVGHSRSICGFLDTRPHPYGIPLELIQGAQDELILICKPHCQTGSVATVHLINGTNGSLHQKMLVDVLKCPYIVVSPSKSTFALISRQELTRTVRIQTFSRQRSGQFAETRVEIVDPPGPRDFGLLALDPFCDGVVALRKPDAAPYCSSLEDSCDDDLLSTHRAAFKPFFGPNRLDRCLITSAAAKVALPPLSEETQLLLYPIPKK